MKFPSIQTIVQATIVTGKRFPLAILFMLTGSFFGILHNHLPYGNIDNHHYYINVIWSAYLGMLLTLAVALYAERKNFPFKIKLFNGIIAVGLIVAYYFSLPDHSSHGPEKQFILFIIGLHLLVAFAPFTAKGEVNGFWQYNKTLFLRFLSAALYSGVFYIGLALAMAAIDNLFKVDIREKWYIDLWICVFCVFNTIFFLGGLPSGFKNLQAIKDYPKGLKIFTQYVLLPIITVYLLILYAYTFKITVTRQWPYGWVSYLVLAFAIAGIFSFLLFHPIKDDAQNKWILIFNRFFYMAICPLIILLFLAINRRIGQYGITEERYFVLILTCWLAFITAYFLFSKNKNIKIIPFTLCALAFLISFGPWSAFSVSLKSQSQRLKQFLQANNMLSEGQKLIPARENLHPGDAEQIRSIINYVVEAHGYHALQPFFPQNLDSMMKDEKGKYLKWDYLQSEKLTDYARLDEFDKAGNKNRLTFLNVSPSKEDTLISLSGFEYLINSYSYYENSESDSLISKYYPGNIALQVVFVKNSGILFLKYGTEKPVEMDIPALIKSLKMDLSDYSHQTSQSNLIVEGENNVLSVKCVVKEIGAQNYKDSITITKLVADILLHIKHPQSALRKQ